MADPSNSLVTNPTQQIFQAEGSTISMGEGKTARAFLRSAGTFNVEQAFSPQPVDNEKQMGSSLTERSSITTQEHSKTTKEALSPAQKLAGRLREYYIDVKTLGMFEYHFFEQLPEALKSIYMDCKNDLLKFINIDCAENPSQEEEALLSRHLPLRLTEILNEIIRQSTIITLEETEWLVPLLLLLDEFKILLPSRENRKFIRPMYQFACTVHDNDRLPVDRRLSILMFMQENGELLDFTASEYRLFESLIKSLLDNHQPAHEAEPAILLEATHIDEPPSTGALTALQEDAPTRPGSGGITHSRPNPEQQQAEATVNTPVTSDALTEPAVHEVAKESSRKPEPKQNLSVPRKKDRKKKQKPPEDEIDAALREIRELETKPAAKKRASKAPDVNHEQKCLNLRKGSLDGTTQQLPADNSNAPNSDSARTQFFDLLDGDVKAQSRHFTELANNGCNPNQPATVTVDKTPLNTTPLLYAMHRYDELLERKMFASETERKDLQEKMANIEESFFNLLSTDRTGIDQPGQCLRGENFPAKTPKVMNMTPFQFALSRQLIPFARTLRSFGADPNTVLNIGSRQYAPAHIASMAINESTELIFQILLSPQAVSPVKESDIPRTDLSVITMDASTPLHVLAKTEVMRLQDWEKDGIQVEPQWLDQDFRNLSRITEMLRAHHLNVGKKNKSGQTAKAYFTHLTNRKITSEQLKQDALKKFAPLFTEQGTGPVQAKASNPVSSPHEKPLPTPDSALSGEAHKKKKPQSHQNDVGTTVSTLPAVAPTPTISTHPLEELSRYSIMLGLGWIDKAMEKLTAENINALIPRKEITPLLDVFNHTVKLQKHHVNSMIEKDCDFNAHCPCTISGERLNTSIGLYAVHKVADLSSSTLSEQDQEARKDAIFHNLNLLIKAGVDINMPAEFLTEDIFSGLTTEPVMIYTPVQLAAVKKQHEMIKFLLKHEANPNKPLRPGNLECYPIHVACMKFSLPGSIETLSALFSPGKFHTDPNLLTYDNSTPVHCLVEAAIMKLKKLETTYSTYTEKRICNIQRSHIAFMEINELKQMTSILRQHGTDFDQPNSHSQTALELFRTRVKEAMLAPEVKEDMKRLDVFFTASEPPAVRPISTQTGRVNKAKWR
ncbi:ankyrin repeat domain-containing protein [Endozoicomonas elysicola]|uniref:Ankyrin n=1 Tax=Endozoicomonas elysicola TaxID=305900 RepID=A0A081KAU6_9GAMM|nr:ankyrin repeat domain-containing protein [Endozoicomonas elysicola]KEI71272.1 hypothetical protein GV64_11425 [Endozoicomonas elysicola]